MATDTQQLEVVPGLAVERLLEGQVMAFNIASSARQVVDAFVAFIKEMQQHRSADEISYFLFDFSDSPAGFHTPYGRARMEELLSWRTELIAYSGIILPRNFITQIARSYLDSIYQERLTVRIFSARDEALSWLQAAINKHKRLF